MISGGETSEATIVAARYPRWIALVGTAVYGALAILGPLNKYPSLPKHVPVIVIYLVSIVLATALVWGFSRSWRMGLRMDDRGVTVRNYFRTYRIGWPEVNSFADGAVNGGASGRQWALKVNRRNGPAVTACGTCLETWKGPPRDETLTAIRQSAERHGIPADVTGNAAGRGGRLLIVLTVALIAFAWWSGANLNLAPATSGLSRSLTCTRTRRSGHVERRSRTGSQADGTGSLLPPAGPQAQGWTGKRKSIHCRCLGEEGLHPLAIGQDRS